MRFMILAIAALPFVISPAAAYENFIPLGHNYAPDDPELPEFNSDQDRINSQVDIYETDIWTRMRAAKSFSSRRDQFSNNQELDGASDFIDY